MPYYTAATQACDGEATHILTHWQRGRFVVTLEGVVPNQFVEVGDLIVSEIVGMQIFEFLLTDVLRAEIR